MQAGKEQGIRWLEIVVFLSSSSRETTKRLSEERNKNMELMLYGVWMCMTVCLYGVRHYTFVEIFLHMMF